MHAITPLLFADHGCLYHYRMSNDNFISSFMMENSYMEAIQTARLFITAMDWIKYNRSYAISYVLHSKRRLYIHLSRVGVFIYKIVPIITTVFDL